MVLKLDVCLAALAFTSENIKNMIFKEVNFVHINIVIKLQ